MNGCKTKVSDMDKSTLFVSKNIGEYQKLLSTSYFFRIHKKYLINLKYIININNSDGSNCELVGKLMLPVAKRRKEDLVSFLNIR
nr:hypothetical protein [uncultured bacterium]